MLYRILILLYLEILKSNAFFHEPSMKIIDAPNSVTGTGLFGYGVTYLSSKKSLIVSAPRSDVFGQVFLIDLQDYTIRNVHSQHLMQAQARTKNASDIVTEWWFGASVRAGHDFFVACAPRFNELKPFKKGSRIEKLANVGVCFVHLGDLKYMELLQPITKHDRWLNATSFEKKMDTFGWSILITKPDEAVAIGGPAQHTGRVIVYEDMKKRKEPILINRKILSNDPVRLNFGYSIAYGNFFSAKPLYAISTTFGDLGFPKVYFFTKDYAYVDTIIHEQLGTMFGACLCAVRLQGNFDSLLIGAPTYAQETSSSDTGAVYIYVPNSDTSPTMLTLKKVITGKKPGGYFGVTMTNLGDMDGDKIDEVAIAAPYEDEGVGAVYIFTGGDFYSIPLRIKAEGFHAFGLSLATLWDYDDNGSNELSIGAPESNKVVIFRSLASITVYLKTEFPRLQFAGDKTEEDISFNVVLDVLYPEKPNDIKAEIVITLEITDGRTRVSNVDETLDVKNGEHSFVFSLNDKQPRYTQSIGVRVVIPVSIFINSFPQLGGKSDVFEVLSYKVTAKLREDPKKLPFDPHRVLLSKRSVLLVQESKVSSSCGAGKARCMPKLRPEVKTSIRDNYIIGSTEREQFNVSISNSGDIAYNPCARIKIDGVRILQPPKNCIQNSIYEFICSPAVPVLTGKKWDINNIELEMNTLKSKDEEILISFDLQNHCNDETEKWESYTSSTKLYPEYNFDIIGRSNPSDIIDTTVPEILEFQKTITHVYTITNDGITNWERLECHIQFNDTSHISTMNSSALVYPETGAIQCLTDVASGVFTCDFPLNRKQKAQVHVTIELIPQSFEVKSEDYEVLITSELKLINDATVFLSISTELHIQTTSVATWIIVASSLLGLLLLLLVAFGLYKCGFFRRANREKLEGLRQSVYRQSVYRMSMRQSANAPKNAEDHQTLVKEDKQT
ncbi:unnamed protein product [Leptosia nina]|uniref:Uncharacterized protein n=1 Tax=Leptosia nina TaxID=320188 RepID=A0AAV1JAZ1_9NEOP